MDPISIFNALYDTKVLKLGENKLESGLVAPYDLNLRRLALYPELMEAIVTQLVGRHLTDKGLSETTSQLRRQLSTLSADSIVQAKRLAADGKPVEPASSIESDTDSQIGEEEASSSCEEEPYAMDHNLDVILCGVPFAAMPIAAAAAYKAKLPLLVEQKATNDHKQCPMKDFTADTRSVSKQQLAKQQRVVLIEGVIRSGQSVLDTIRSLAQRNLKVEFVICIVDSEEGGIKGLLEEANIRVLPLYTMSAILRVLEATGRISSQKFLAVRQWIAARNQISQSVDSHRPLASPLQVQKPAKCTIPVQVNQQALKEAPRCLA